MPAYCMAPELRAAEVSATLLAPSLLEPEDEASTVEALLERISNYLLTNNADEFKTAGRGFLRDRIEFHVKQKIPLLLVLPAFPFKSPSLKKVLGTLPDLAEELVLKRLETMCRSLEDVYSPGVQLILVSDGIVYGQLVGVSDNTIYQYNAELRKMAADMNLNHIHFVRVHELLERYHTSSEIAKPPAPEAYDVSEKQYVASAARTREIFLSVDIGPYSVDDHIRTDEGALRTYRGYLRFLKLDLEGTLIPQINPENARNSLKTAAALPRSGPPISRRKREKFISTTAKRMMENGARFSALVEKAFPTAVRLSIHAHVNSGPKFAIRAFSGIDNACTPWHNTAVYRVDGSISVQHSHTVDRTVHEIIYRRGRPYGLQEVDQNTQWQQYLPPGVDISFEPLHPFGLMIRSSPSAEGSETRKSSMSWEDVPMVKVRGLLKRFSLVIFRGFGNVNKELYVKKAHEMGQVQPWVFGDVLEVKDNPEVDMNNVLTREAMPMHFDGLFKIKKGVDGCITSDPPQFQMFQCLNAPTASVTADVGAGGRTLFSNTAHIFKEAILPVNDLYASVNNRTWSVYTPMNKNFGGDPLRLPLITENPVTGHCILRWHERWPQRITQFKPTDVEIDGLDESLSVSLGNRLTELLYDRRFCYEHTWQAGDFLVADNIELLHSRTAFTPCSRELWRIHIN